MVAGVAFKSALFHRSAFFLRIWRNRLIADSVAAPLVASFFWTLSLFCHFGFRVVWAHLQLVRLHFLDGGGASGT